jgi:zinc/manganese transport system substrate-binding protein
VSPLELRLCFTPHTRHGVNTVTPDAARGPARPLLAGGGGSGIRTCGAEAKARTRPLAARAGRGLPQWLHACRDRGVRSPYCRGLAVLLLAALALVLSASPAKASPALQVFACEPEWGALVEELGGDRVSVFAAITALQDAHHIQARPALIARMRNADLVVCNGAELEIGWLPLLLLQSANPHVQPGTPGLFMASDYVHLIEIPPRYDRAEGDLHAAGNPHFVLDARVFLPIAHALAAQLAVLDPAGSDVYRRRHEDFVRRWEQAIGRWEKQAAGLRGIPVLVATKTFVYLSAWLGLVEIATLEPKPGIPPSTAHLNLVLARMQARPARFVIRAAFEDPHPVAWISDRSGIPAVEIPYTVGGSVKAGDLVSLFDDTVKRLLAALPAARN